MTMLPGEAQAKPGSPSYRLIRLLEELDKRFPVVVNPVLSDPPEPKLLAAIDAMQAELDNWEKSQELPEWDGDSPKQDWANTPPAVAFHLVEKYAENWTHAGQLMQAYLDAHTAPLTAELAVLRHDLERYIAIAGEEAARAEGLAETLKFDATGGSYLPNEIFAGTNVWGSTFHEWCEFMRCYGYAPEALLDQLKSAHKRVRPSGWNR